MTAEQRREPIAWEEDVACALDFFQGVETGCEIAVGEWFACGIVEQGKQ